MSDLLTRARNTSAMLRMCEKISFGSDADVIDELVEEVERLRNMSDADVIDELVEEVDRLRNMLNDYGKLDAELAIAERRIESLSRTGAVKVDDIDRRAKEAADAIGVTPHSDMRIFVEQAAKYALSALESAAPEGQQPVAWMDATGTELHKIIQDYQKRDMIESGGRQAERAPNYSIALFTRPAEQAVTEAMVDAVVEAIRPYTRDTLFLDEHQILVREALKAVMEAGR